MKMPSFTRLTLVVLTILGLLAATWLWLRETPTDTPLAQTTPATVVATEVAALEAGASSRTFLFSE